MHRYGNLDTYALARTNRWRDPRSADVYVHTEVGSEARMADVPTPQSVQFACRTGPIRTSPLKIKKRHVPSHGRGRRFNPYSAHH